MTTSTSRLVELRKPSLSPSTSSSLVDRTRRQQHPRTPSPTSNDKPWMSSGDDNNSVSSRQSCDRFRSHSQKKAPSPQLSAVFDGKNPANRATSPAPSSSSSSSLSTGPPKLVSPVLLPQQQHVHKLTGKKHTYPPCTPQPYYNLPVPYKPLYHYHFDMSHYSSMQLLNAMNAYHTSIPSYPSAFSSSSSFYDLPPPPPSYWSSPSHRKPYSNYPYYQSGDPSQFNRKRQRRQAAAVVVDSLFNGGGLQQQQSQPSPQPPYAANQQQEDHQSHTMAMGRKSTAQPRPKLTVPPRGIGPIVEPNQNDVLCGRGGRINSHSGNVQFRDVINARKKEYLAPSTKKLEKAHIAAAIVYEIRAMDPPGRFLKEDRDTGLWFDIGDAKAIKKTGQALREDAPDIRHELDDGSSGDEQQEGGGHSPKGSVAVKKEEKKSPPPQKALAAETAQPPSSFQRKVPISNPSPLQFNRQTGHGPQQMPGTWSQQHGGPSPTPYDHQAMAAMPPPNAMNNEGFVARSIPIPVPPAAATPNAWLYMPQNLYSGGRSVSNKVSVASKQAMAALNPTSATYQGHRHQAPPDDIAFGRAFHPPEEQSTLSGMDNTMSTISGLSEPLSSTFGPNSLMSGKSRGQNSSMQNNSLRLSNIQSVHGSSVMNTSSLNWGRAVQSINSNNNSSLRGLARSFSFPDMGSVFSADDDMIDNETAMAKSILSNGSRGGNRNSSGMSISGLSLDLASTASSTQWLAANGLIGPGGEGVLAAAPLPDDRTYLSGMSTEFDALDLACNNNYVDKHIDL